MYPYLFSLLLLVSSAIGCDSKQDRPNNANPGRDSNEHSDHAYTPTPQQIKTVEEFYTTPIPQDATRQQLVNISGQGLTLTKVPDQPSLVNGGVAPEIPHKTEGDVLISSIRELTPKQVSQLVTNEEVRDPWAYQVASPIKDELPEDAFIRYRNQVISCGEILLGQTNQLRSRKGLKSLALDTNLQKHATQWSVHMANSAGLQHGDDHFQGSTNGQNIAEGQTTATEVMASWINSPGHYANIVNPAYTKVGFGWAYNPKGVIYWTCNFSN